MQEKVSSGPPTFWSDDTAEVAQLVMIHKDDFWASI